MEWFKLNKILALSVFAVFICFSIFGYIFFDMFSAKKTVDSKIEELPISSELKFQSNTIEYNPFGDQKTKLIEKDIQHYIHGMSHQKVKAEEKWVHYTITEERIQFLLEVVQNGDYEYKDVYLDILTRWSKGDFSQADKDHNVVWQLLGGSVGKATGILTKEEEQAYLEKYKSVRK